MKMSRRAQRMERHHRKHRGAGALNLVSLMDIFTILVFFLLVNSAEVEVLPTTKILKLPESSAEQRPRETVTVTVTPRHIVMQGRSIAALAEVSGSGLRAVPELTRALEEVAGRAAARPPAEREVTVLADRSIPYRILKKVMVSCREAEFGRVSLAVLQKLPESRG